jgi:hypothetical protein
MPKKTAINYGEGTCFFVPLYGGGFARGVVARLDGSGRVFAYFFGPKLEEPSGGFNSLKPRDALLAGRFGDPGLLSGEWPLAGTLEGWSRDDWPLPAFYRADVDAKKAWLSYYDEDTLNCISEVPTELEQEPFYPYDRLMGCASVETRLTKLLATSPR